MPVCRFVYVRGHRVDGVILVGYRVKVSCKYFPSLGHVMLFLQLCGPNHMLLTYCRD